MKKEFSSYWTGSRQVRKQRKYRYNSPLHAAHKLMSATLSKELRKKHQRRNFPVRKGDLVRVMRGAFKKKEGKIDRVDLKKKKASIEGIQKIKKDGSKISVLFDPSKLMIKELVIEDKERIQAMEKKKNAPQSK